MRFSNKHRRYLFLILTVTLIIVSGISWFSPIGLGMSSIIHTHFSSSPKIFTDSISGSGIIQKGSAQGVSFGDYNNDGRIDIFIAGSEMNGNILYHNNGNNTFTDVTKLAGIQSIPNASVGIFGDYDNDGCPDLFLSRGGSYDTLQSKGDTGILYKNNCNGTFRDVSKSAGFTIPSHARGAAWADYDNDGYLDVYIANHGIVHGADQFTVEPNMLYHNNKDGTFTNVAKKAGVEGFTACKASKGMSVQPPYPHQFSLKESYQPIWFDYNNDTKPDLYITTDWGVSPLYENNGDGTFTDVTQKSGMCIKAGWMGVTAADYDNDGFFDLYATIIGSNVLWHNNGNGTFTDIGNQMNVDHYALGWGTEFIDYDNDGLPDLFVANGRVTDKQIQNTIPTEKDFLYKNEKTVFASIDGSGIADDESNGAAAVADINNDGFPDIFECTDYKDEEVKKSAHHLYLNQPNGNHWITVKLTGTISNKSAIGARVKLTRGKSTQMQMVTSGSSFQSQRSPWLTFGLGKNPRIDSVEITWPSGIKQTIHPLTDRIISVTENDAR